jgi:ribulose-5-phosphate 4-epimerase/fuculose-1-phosphate aldolase
MAEAALVDRAGIRDRVSDEEWALRCKLATAFRAFHHMGWDDLIFTHLSVRVPGPEHHFLINAYDQMFDEVTASSLVKIDVEGHPVLNTGQITNPAGFTIHSALHMNRLDAHCVMHLHTIAGQAVSALEEGLLPTCQTAMIGMSGGLAYHDYEGIATDLDERERLVADMGPRQAMILRNHGTLTVGKSVEEAFLLMYFLERGCQVQVAAQSTGQKLNGAPQGTPEKVAQQVDGQLELAGQFLAWPALTRRMLRVFPDMHA